MKLITLLPDYYDKNETMIRLQGILSAETDKLDVKLSSTISECFVTTASAMLSRYEKIYGINVDVAKSDSLRRERIKAKVIGSATTTVELVQEITSNYTNHQIEVYEDNLNNRFRIRFVGTLKEPDTLGDLMVTIEEIKPAHLDVTYEYIYNSYCNIVTAALTSQRTGITAFPDASNKYITLNTPIKLTSITMEHVKATYAVQ